MIACSSERLCAANSVTVLSNQTHSTDQDFAYSAFISYAQADQKIAYEIAESLEAHGLKCWIAPRDLRPAREYGDEIIRGITRSRCCILVLSKSANASKFVRKEVERAVSKDRPLLTVRIEDVLPSPALELFVSGTHWIDAWSGNVASHAKHLTELLAEEESGAGPADSLVEPFPRDATQAPLDQGDPAMSSGITLGAMGVAIAAGTVLGIIAVVALLIWQSPDYAADPIAAAFPDAPESQQAKPGGAPKTDPYAGFADAADPGPPVTPAPNMSDTFRFDFGLPDYDAPKSVIGIGTPKTKPETDKPKVDPSEALWLELEAKEPGRYKLMSKDEYETWHEQWKKDQGRPDLSGFGTAVDADISKLKLSETREIAPGFVQIIVSNLGTTNLDEITIGYRGKPSPECSPNLDSYDGVKKFPVRLSAGDSVTLFQQVGVQAKQFCIVSAR